jgi:hypothetical protein
MTDERFFKAYINPLAFLEVDEPWASHMPKPPDFGAVLRFLCPPEVKSDLEEVIGRYREISNESKRLFAAPAEKNILEKLVWPLRNAKASYMLGNYLGTISLSGTVAEMVAILTFEISNLTINGKRIDQKTQEKIFTRTFENLGQDQRVKVLHAFNLIDDEIKSYFDIVRDKRKRYLHLFSHEHTEIARDAIAVYDATVNILVRVIGQNVKDGIIMLNPDLIKYLEQKGVMEEDRAQATMPQAAEESA